MTVLDWPLDRKFSNMPSKSKVIIWRPFPSPRPKAPPELSSLITFKAKDDQPQLDETVMRRWIELADVSDAAGPALENVKYARRKSPKRFP